MAAGSAPRRITPIHQTQGVPRRRPVQRGAQRPLLAGPQPGDHDACSSLADASRRGHAVIVQRGHRPGCAPVLYEWEPDHRHGGSIVGEPAVPTPERRVAVVTGANHGIGAATAVALAAAGVDVLVTYLRLRRRGRSRAAGGVRRRPRRRAPTRPGGDRPRARPGRRRRGRPHRADVAGRRLRRGRAPLRAGVDPRQQRQRLAAPTRSRRRRPTTSGARCRPCRRRPSSATSASTPAPAPC